MELDLHFNICDKYKLTEEVTKFEKHSTHSDLGKISYRNSYILLYLECQKACNSLAEINFLEPCSRRIYHMDLYKLNAVTRCPNS